MCMVQMDGSTRAPRLTGHHQSTSRLTTRNKEEDDAAISHHGVRDDPADM
jgi:hypothetical protein